MFFAFIFSERITITSSKEALKVWEHNFYQEMQTKSSITCNLSVQLQFAWVNFLHVEPDIWMAYEIFYKSLIVPSWL